MAPGAMARDRFSSSTERLDCGMPKTSRWLHGALAAVALTLTGCPDTPTTPGPGQVSQDADGNATLTDPSGKPLPFTKLSELDTARFADTAIGADGTLHVIFSEQPRGGKAMVFYRASTDGGATWSPTLNLSEVDRGRAAGVPHIAVDKQGRVYAAWKAMKESVTEDSLRGGAYGAPLVFRVLEGGQWSDLKTVDTNGLVRSWFMAVDPTGQAHVVWVENGIAAGGYKTILASRFAQATLTGTTVGPEKELLAAAPANPDDSGHLWRLPDYGGVRGYVDATGTAHWSAYKVPVDKGEEAAMLVLWDGKRERESIKYADYASFVGPYYNPPELVVDAQGDEHVLLQDAKGATPGLLDLRLKTGQPAVVHATAPKSEFKTFQVVKGQRGEVAALMTYKDAAAAKPTFDLFVSRLESGAWTKPVNVTNNALRASYKEIRGSGANSAEVSVSYEPSYASGAFDAAGRLNLVMVNDEKASISTNSLGAYDGDLVNVVQGGLVVNPQVLFIKL